MSFKNSLQELCSRKRWNLPVYEDIQQGPPHAPYFTTTVTIEGKGSWTSDRLSTKKMSQQDAAAKALEDLTSRSTAESTSQVNTNYKNQLQEFLQKKGEQIPTWISFQRSSDKLWGAKVNILYQGVVRTWESEKGFLKVKYAEHDVARIALEDLTNGTFKRCIKKTSSVDDNKNEDIISEKSTQKSTSSSMDSHSFHKTPSVIVAPKGVDGNSLSSKNSTSSSLSSQSSSKENATSKTSAHSIDGYSSSSSGQSSISSKATDTSKNSSSSSGQSSTPKISVPIDTSSNAIHVKTKVTNYHFEIWEQAYHTNAAVIIPPGLNELLVASMLISSYLKNSVKEKKKHIFLVNEFTSNINYSNNRKVECKSHFVKELGIRVKEMDETSQILAWPNDCEIMICESSQFIEAVESRPFLLEASFLIIFDAICHISSKHSYIKLFELIGLIQRGKKPKILGLDVSFGYVGKNETIKGKLDVISKIGNLSFIFPKKQREEIEFLITQNRNNIEKSTIQLQPEETQFLEDIKNAFSNNEQLMNNLQQTFLDFGVIACWDEIQKNLEHSQDEVIICQKYDCKQDLLIQILDSNYNPSLSCLVITRKKEDNQKIIQYLNENKDSLSFLTFEELTEKNYKDFYENKFNIAVIENDQAHKFRLKKCDLIIHFDAGSSYKGIIQSRTVYNGIKFVVLLKGSEIETFEAMEEEENEYIKLLV